MGLVLLVGESVVVALSEEFAIVTLRLYVVVGVEHQYCYLGVAEPSWNV